MRVTLFGTRGSIPAPGPETIRYGGNTPAVEVRAKNGATLAFDAGTGIRRLGAQVSPATNRIDILLTHLHMDHIQGLGFFGPLYDPAIEVHIWGPASSTLSLEARLSRYLSPPLFPVHLRDLPSVACHRVPRQPFDIGPFHIETSLVCHPGPTVGYRVEEDGGVVAYMCDHEPALCLRGGRWPGREWISGFDLAVGVDLLIHDAQYTDEEYERCLGCGHSTYRHAFEFAAQVGAKQIVPFHHDPSHDDEMLDRQHDIAVRRIKPDFAVSHGREGAVFYVGSKSKSGFITGA
jgi:phosphoribosyl 1,2-cyclic phosphodiesterase